MNRYVIEGMLDDAACGKRVLCVYGISDKHAPSAVEHRIRTLLPDPTEYAGAVQAVVRANGREEIRFTNGGRIRFLRSYAHGSSALRGFSVDVVVLLNSAVGMGLLTHAKIATAASSQGEVIRA